MFCFFTAERSERVQKTYFSLTNIFVHLLLFCATPLNLPSWSLFFLVVVEVARPPTLVSWESSAVLLDNLYLCVWLMIMTYTGTYHFLLYLFLGPTGSGAGINEIERFFGRKACFSSSPVERSRLGM